MSSKRETFFLPYRSFPYFTKDTLRASAERFGMPLSTFNSYIYKGLQEGQIIALKRNHYVTRAFYEAHKTETAYLFFLANTLLRPSYVSLESALQYYGLFAEAVPYAITSVTLKLPRRFENRLGFYSYRNITESLFTDFKIVRDPFEFAIALPHKAIFDTLYYYTHGFTRNVHADLLEDLRIDMDELNSKDKQLLAKLLTSFTSVKIHL